jgi:hypothetical protein
LFENLQRALPNTVQNISLFMGGAHGDVYAVFDYAPDTVLLTKSRGEDAEYEEEEEEEETESAFTRWPTVSIAESPRVANDNDSAIESSDTDETPADPTVPAPRGRPGAAHRQSIGFPRVNTTGADSILSTSPSNRKGRLATDAKAPRLHFDDSVRPFETSPVGSADSESEQQQNKSMLQQIYPDPPVTQNMSATASGHVGGGRRQSLALDLGMDWDERAQQQPYWAKNLGETLKRLEERQERIEGMLKLGPGEGD